MDDDVFLQLAERTKTIIGEDTGGTHKFIDALIDLWQEHHGAGLSVFHFSHILGEVALGASILMEEHLEEAEIFARELRDGAEKNPKNYLRELAASRSDKVAICN
jgi:hypothetical protein